MPFHVCYDMQRNRWIVRQSAETPIMSIRSKDTRPLAETVCELLNSDPRAFQIAMDAMCDKMLAA